MRLREKDDHIEHETKVVEDDKGEEKASDYQNPIVILKRRLMKIVDTNKEKRKLMD